MRLSRWALPAPKRFGNSDPQSFHGSTKALLYLISPASDPISYGPQLCGLLLLPRQIGFVDSEDVSDLH